MNASPQPSVVPGDLDGPHRMAALRRRSRPSKTRTALRPERDHEHPTEVVRHRRIPATSGVVLGAGPADEAEVDVGHRLGEPLDGVVAEAEEVRGRRSIRRARRRRRAASSSAIAPSTSTTWRRCAPASASRSRGVSR